MRKQTTTYRKKFIRKLGINTRNFGDTHLQVLFEEWPVVERDNRLDFVLTLSVLEDNSDEEDRCSSILSRREVAVLIEFLQDLLDNPCA